jgi:hypothetical protein
MEWRKHRKENERDSGFKCSSHIHSCISDTHTIQSISVRPDHADKMIVKKNKQPKKIRNEKTSLISHHIITSPFHTLHSPCIHTLPPHHAFLS